MSASSFLIADRSDARLYACIADVRFTPPKVSTSRFSASLSPFPDAEAAKIALAAAGGKNVRAI